MPPVEDARFTEAITRLEAARRRWLTGGDADVSVGALAAGTEGGEGQLRLLAEAAQLRQIALRPVAPTQMTRVAPIPTLDLPLLDQALRPMFRRVIAASNERAHAQAVIGLMANRGVMAHPFDWVPPKDGAGFPEVYWPLADWVAGQEPIVQSALTAASWEDFSPNARRKALVELRSSDPDAARALLETFAATLAAEERLGLVETLLTGLNPADQPYLESLLTDRSGKVKTAARRLLGRLGVLAADDDARELAAFFETRKALLSRKVSIELRTKLNQVQINRISTLLESVTISQLAHALDTDEAGLVQQWSMKNDLMAELMLRALIAGASDYALRTYWERFKGEENTGMAMLFLIAPRLSIAEIQTEALVIIRKGRLDALPLLAGFIGHEIPQALADAILADPRVRDVFKVPDDDTKSHELTLARDTLRLLGPILRRETAIAVRDRLQGKVFHPADPALDPLHFNIALEGHA